MRVSSDAIETLAEVRAVNLEADLIRMLSKRFDIPAENAMQVYYESGFSELIARNEHGEQYLDSSYLFDELLKQLARG